MGSILENVMAQMFTANGFSLHYFDTHKYGELDFVLQNGTGIDLADCPDLGPVLMVLGLFCKGQTVIRNAERLRIKESDRIEAMETELRKCGGVLSSAGGTITIEGCAGALHAPDGVLSGHNDHRVVMSLSVLHWRRDCGCHRRCRAITKSWPNFFTAIKPLGAEVEDVG